MVLGERGDEDLRRALHERARLRSVLAASEAEIGGEVEVGGE
jgi:hypothetical protein